ncbi:MAG: ParB N-terminal domain-containing protein [Alphaproteobacteria bacterium]|nr:ParB N-terminal domain-containing protein [Rhodospirillales bacterium]MCW9044829.1 ParB N-terminal domain-containing protein [Alphaproteobacteria bacterium]
MNINIPLKDLDLSPLNVRKTPPTAAEQAELAASIFSHGLLENLIVRPLENGRYEVLAGGRRLVALQSLVRDGELGADHPVACLVHDGDPQEVSLAENIVRLSMHALDQFEAFAALSDQGLSVIEIANRFGNTETLVRQRLRLGRVVPEIREACREDKINLETLMAFAVTDDNGEQLAVWEQLKDGHLHAHHVRRLLTDEKIAANSRFVQFIGLEAYEAAGGASMQDLFSQGNSSIYLEDRALVMRLCQEKLSAAATELQTAEGWKWMQSAPEFSYEATKECQNVYPKNIEPTPEQEAESKKIQDGLELYQTMDMDDDLSPEDEEAYQKLQDKEEALENSLKAYEPEDLARAGCMISLNHDGSLQVRRGLVLPEDQEADPNAKTKASGTYSAKLLEDLGNTRLEIAQKHLARDFDCAFDMMLFTIAHATLKVGYMSGKPLDINFTTTLPYNWSERFNTTGAELSPEIDISWLELAPVPGFKALSAMSMEDKQRLFAHCTALTMQGRLGGVGGNDLHEVIGRRLNIDTAAHWRPNAENFFKRVTKARALEIAAVVLGEKWAKNHSGEKKDVLADTLEANFNGNRTPGVTPEQAAIAARWLPEGMAYLVNHDQPLAEVPTVENELPDAFCLPAAE